MPANLNPDLLHLICGALADGKDFATLYSCALSSKVLAVPAIANLYRVHNKAPVIGAASDDSPLAVDRGKATLKLVTLWRSIVLSGFEQQLTYDIYSRSVRKLDFEELEQLFDSPTFRGKASDTFFAGNMQQFRVERTVQIPAGKAKGKHVTLDIGATTNNIAQFILQKTPLLEKLSGKFSTDIIQGFLPHTERLTRLRVFDGSVLKGTGSYFYESCRHFNKIGVYGWRGDDADQDCASFLNELRPQSLRSFCVFSSSALSLETYLALNCHSQTLSRLELRSIDADSMQHIASFKDCINLRVLFLGENGRATQDLNAHHNDSFTALIEWLQKCKSLKDVKISNFVNATALLTPFLRERGVELEILEVQGYQLHGSNEFHQALPLQQTLKSLWLKGEDSEDALDNRMLVESLSRLPTLTDLRLTQISASFTEYHISVLAEHLPKLETFWTSGFHITDSIWTDFQKFKQLKRLELNADTRFTSNGILRFISSLDEEHNKGFILSVMMQDTDCNIPEPMIEIIRDELSRKLNGKFDFQLLRGLEELEYSDDDSD